MPTVPAVGAGRSPRYRAAAAWGAAAGLWLVVWFHGSRTHGVTQENEHRLWLGLTWMDSAKFLVVPLAVLALALALLGRVNRPSGRIARLAWLAALVVAGLQVLAVALEFWPFPWGSYSVSFDDAERTTAVGGGVQAGASLLMAVLMVPVGIGFVRAGVIPAWVVPALAVGMLWTSYMTPPAWVPAVAWLLVAGGLVQKAGAIPAENSG